MLNRLLSQGTAAFNEARQRLGDEMKRYTNRKQLEAIVSGCAAMAFADKHVSSEEKQKMYGFLQASDELKVFKLDEVLAYFDSVVKKFEFDFDIGLAEALKTISKLKGDEGASKLLVRVCIRIGGSDGNFDENEKNVARKIALELGLNPAEFDL